MGKRLIIPGADFSANAIEQEPFPVEFTLQNGYASGQVPYNTIEIDVSDVAIPIRVRTGQIEGSYSVKTKPGYVIRAICTYGTSIDTSTPGNKNTTDVANVPNVQGTTSYDLSNEGKFSIITFCKTDATQAISASEDIVDYIVRPVE